MNVQADLKQCTLYRLITDEELLVAVTPDYQVQIEKLIKEFGDLAEIPVSKTVRGIFVRSIGNSVIEPVSASLQQNDITVNQLRHI